MDSGETMIGKVFRKEEKKKEDGERRVHDRRSWLIFNGRVHPFVISQNLADNLVYGGKAESARWSNLLSVSAPPPPAIYVSARSPYLATVSSLRSTRVKCRFTVTLSVFLLPSNFPRSSPRSPFSARRAGTRVYRSRREWSTPICPSEDRLSHGSAFSSAR